MVFAFTSGALGNTTTSWSPDAFSLYWCEMWLMISPVTLAAFPWAGRQVDHGGGFGGPGFSASTITPVTAATRITASPV